MGSIPTAPTSYRGEADGQALVKGTRIKKILRLSHSGATFSFRARKKPRELGVIASLANPSELRAWLVAAGAFGVAFATNTLFLAIDMPLGWALRGSTHTPGGPTATDVRFEHILDAAFVVALLVNLGLPIAIAIARKWRGLAGVGLAWAATPLAWIMALAIDFVVLQLA